MCFRDVRTERHRTRAVHRERPPSKVTDLDALEGDDGLVVVVEVLRRLPPERHSARVARPVDNGEVSFRYLGERKAAWAGKERENKRVEKMSEMKGQGAGRVKRTNRLVGGFAGNGSHLGTFLDDGEDI
jgi:hypothetical protein